MEYNENIFNYADLLYAKALRKMEAEDFRNTDIFALSAYGAALYVRMSSASSDILKERASILEQAAWNLAAQSYFAQRKSLLKPRMSGREDNPVLHDMEEAVRISEGTMGG